MRNVRGLGAAVPEAVGRCRADEERLARPEQPPTPSEPEGERARDAPNRSAWLRWTCAGTKPPGRTKSSAAIRSLRPLDEDDALAGHRILDRAASILIVRFNHTIKRRAKWKPPPGENVRFGDAEPAADGDAPGPPPRSPRPPCAPSCRSFRGRSGSSRAGGFANASERARLPVRPHLPARGPRDSLGVAASVAGTFGSSASSANAARRTLVDRFGARRILRGRCSCSPLGYGLFPLVREPWQAFVFMAIAGLGNGGFWPSQSALYSPLPDRAPPQVSAVTRVAFTSAPLSAPALGGLIVAGRHRLGV